MDKDTIKITSIHVIPFDIGIDIDERRCQVLEDAFKNYENIPHDKFRYDVSIGFLMGKTIGRNIELYIYRYGVGVFVIEDETPFISEDEHYARDYCGKRSRTHKDIYANRYVESQYIQFIMNLIWDSLKNYRLRSSANKNWELNGISYVMSLDLLETKRPLAEFDDTDKKNLYIILNPHLVEMEDSDSKLAIIENSQFVNLGNTVDPYQIIDVGLINDSNTLNDDISIYTSWATILLCLNTKSKQIKELYECLQVELQAFWFYTYIMTDVDYSAIKYKDVAQLKDMLFYYIELKESFLEIKTTKLPVYLINTWEDMYKTSLLESRMNTAERTLQHAIEKQEQKMQIYQNKYLKINNLLVLSIAFIQIIPYLYGFMIGSYVEGIQLFPCICIVLTFIIMIFIVWKKE